MVSESKDTNQVIAENTLLKKIISCHSIENLIDLMVEKLLCVDGVKNLIFLFNDYTKSSLVYSKTKLSKEYEELEGITLNNTIPLSENTPYTQVYNSKKHLLINSMNYLNQDEYTRYIFKVRKIMELVVFPIGDSQETIGVLSLYSENNFYNKYFITEINKITELFFPHIKTLLDASFLKTREEAINSIYKRNTEVLKIAERLNNITSPTDIFKNAMREIIDIFGFDFGVILIQKEGLLSPLLIETSKKKNVQTHLSDILKFFSEIKGYSAKKADGATSVAFSTKNTFYFEDVSKISKLPMTEYDKKYIDAVKQAKTLLLVPLLKKNIPIGIVQLFSVYDKLELNSFDKDVITSLCSFIGSALENSELYQLIEEQRRNITVSKNKIEEQHSKIVSDLDMAKRLQLSVVDLIENSPEIKVSKSYTAMERLGGDLYDVRRIGKTNYSFLISDVSGHGVPAALITFMAKSSFITHGHFSKTPAEICREVNDDVYKLISDTVHYITAFYAKLDMQTLELTYTNCGHQTPLLYRKSKGIIEDLYAKGVYIGMFENPSYTYLTVKLSIGDKILFYTDGITDIKNPASNRYGKKRLIDFFKNNAELECEEIKISLEKSVKEFAGGCEAEDDMAFMIIEITSKIN
jgi:serine phosphatase RsbU (regulator of sigma subunit)